jgi:hypothetical protein
MSTRTWDALIGFGLVAIGAGLIAASWLLPWPYDLIPGAVCVVGRLRRPRDPRLAHDVAAPPAQRAPRRVPPMSPQEGDDWPVLPDEPDPDGPNYESETVDELTRIALDLEALRPAVPWLKVNAGILLAIFCELLYRIMQG